MQHFSFYAHFYEQGMLLMNMSVETSIMNMFMNFCAARESLNQIIKKKLIKIPQNQITTIL